jgi:hypothetical protein
LFLSSLVNAFANIILADIFPPSFDKGISPYALIRRGGGEGVATTTLISLDKSLIL